MIQSELVVVEERLEEVCGFGGPTDKFGRYNYVPVDGLNTR